jgi:tRNA U34 2-thiouridine synthase MnmA/TrmU
VLVGKKQELENSGFSVCEINWINKDYADKKEFECIAQLRHRHNGSRVKIKIEGDKLHATFLEEWAVVSPGQAAVFYDLSNQEVLGGGKIISALRA